jgi:tripartite-type tricarboxylate transporter receptor subunit TctC
LLALPGASPACAQGVESFYRGRTINVLVPADPGGSYDLYARMLARFMPRFLPGAPTINVQNMPGAGGLRPLNYVYSVAPRDGTWIVMPLQDALINEALGEPGADYRGAEFGWIGRLAYSVDITVTAAHSPVKSIPDAQRVSVPIAATAATSPTVIDHALANNLLDTKFRIVTGYKASNDMLGAIEKGEADGAFTSWTTLKSVHPDWLEQKKVNVIVTHAGQRFAEIPDVPAIVEYARDERDRAILALFGSSGFLGRAFATGPGVPADRLDALRAAFNAMIADPDFLDAMARARADFGPLSGEDMARFARSLRAPDADLVARARVAMKVAR